MLKADPSQCRLTSLLASQFGKFEARLRTLPNQPGQLDYPILDTGPRRSEGPVPTYCD